MRKNLKATVSGSWVVAALLLTQLTPASAIAESNYSDRPSWTVPLVDTLLRADNAPPFYEYKVNVDLGAAKLKAGERVWVQAYADGLAIYQNGFPTPVFAADANNATQISGRDVIPFDGGLVEKDFSKSKITLKIFKAPYDSDEKAMEKNAQLLGQSDFYPRKASNEGYTPISGTSGGSVAQVLFIAPVPTHDCVTGSCASAMNQKTKSVSEPGSQSAGSDKKSTKSGAILNPDQQ